ncbi:hypothetical protein DUNSADRAFT_14002 [Dunaliella salina]|uniref:Uncharacterized protein n=1 Tax=Dunaliella salina TaxID=3046 RepID=A0ABQ7G891_DUNSA|nr:hypothetical protein DUNSADRAFT_14002 [Dunaliella salina]|eukprot:KAF5830812.1 hypothetical protein DUNSADRAFT_14002 [Dunaliella salina]
MLLCWAHGCAALLDSWVCWTLRWLCCWFHWTCGCAGLALLCCLAGLVVVLVVLLCAHPGCANTGAYMRAHTCACRPQQRLHMCTGTSAKPLGPPSGLGGA